MCAMLLAEAVTSAGPRRSENGSGMERLAVLGLGRMGLPIVSRLLTAGYPVTVFDPDVNRIRLAEKQGADGVVNEYQVASQSDVLVTVLPGPAELSQAMLGPRGALEGLRVGACWLDLTSNDPRVATEVAAAAEAAGVMSVGAPMAGGPLDAAAGTLRFYVAGADSAIERVTPILTALGPPNDLVYSGPHVGAAHTTKLLANTLWFGQVAAVTEALLLGQALGLDLGILHSALETSAGGSHFMTHHLDALLRGDYLESFAIDRVVEELDTVTALAESARTPVALTAVVAQLHRDALERFGPVDGELLVAKLLEERAGRLLRGEHSGVTQGPDEASR
jgi:3-hydroxyisobutyrate dehydrogenase